MSAGPCPTCHADWKGPRSYDSIADNLRALLRLAARQVTAETKAAVFAFYCGALAAECEGKCLRCALAEVGQVDVVSVDLEPQAERRPLRAVPPRHEGPCPPACRDWLEHRHPHETERQGAETDEFGRGGEIDFTEPEARLR